MGINLNHNTAGTITLQAPSSGSTTLIFPSISGGDGDFLTTNTQGALSWTSLDTFTTDYAGLVPAPTITDVGKYLRSDGTWNEVTTGGTGTNIGPTVTYTGVLSVMNGAIAFSIPSDCNLISYTAFVGSPSVGSDIVFRIKINGATMFTATIPAGESSIGPILIDQDCYEWDLLTLDITAVGSTYQGTGLTVRMKVG